MANLLKINYIVCLLAKNKHYLPPRQDIGVRRWRFTGETQKLGLVTSERGKEQVSLCVNGIVENAPEYIVLCRARRRTRGRSRTGQRCSREK